MFRYNGALHEVQFLRLQEQLAHLFEHSVVIFDPWLGN